jgi:methylglyoxal synthase
MARRLALIAHDNKKVDLVAWATFNRKTLAEFDLMATRHTARLVRDKVGLEAEELLSGPEGGDAQIAARVATGAVDVVFFFVDPLWSQPHDPDLRALLACLQRPQRPARHESQDGGPDHHRPRPTRGAGRRHGGSGLRPALSSARRSRAFS